MKGIIWVAEHLAAAAHSALIGLMGYGDSE